MIEDGRLYHTFGDIEGKLDVLRVECTKCERKKCPVWVNRLDRSRGSSLRQAGHELRHQAGMVSGSGHIGRLAENLAPQSMTDLA